LVFGFWFHFYRLSGSSSRLYLVNSVNPVLEWAMKLANQTAIITGGGRGIGREIALALAREGADVLLAARDEHALNHVAQEVRELGHKAVVFKTDVSDETQVAAMTNAAMKEFQRIDILVNNAGLVGPTTPLVKLSREEWDEVLAVNLTGAFLCSRAVIPQMMSQGSGSIINIASIAGKVGYALRSPYAVSKWGMLGLSRTLAQELGAHHIRVNAICPGPTAGERMTAVIAGRAKELGRPHEEVERAYLEGTALKQMVNPAHVAAAVVFLASKEGSSITGEAIDITCGFGL
jgi:NAD(P)-dependent dehydrogenase (short-subunit alcohol dehydrogenase family)